jgi:hypothetical protein
MLTEVAMIIISYQIVASGDHQGPPDLCLVLPINYARHLRVLEVSELDYVYAIAKADTGRCLPHVLYLAWLFSKLRH